jgi:hypothetical protein
MEKEFLCFRMGRYIRENLRMILLWEGGFFMGRMARSMAGGRIICLSKFIDDISKIRIS